MNGLELLKRIKNLVPKLDVIVLSCQNNVKVVKDFMKAGIRDYIKKEGLGQHKVKQAISEFIHNWERRDKRVRRLKYAAAFLALIILASAIVFFMSA
jgi:response regulator of citrate/malate metabolism